MREEVRIERLDRLERFLAKVASTSSPPHLVDRWMQTLVELYLGYLRAENSDWPNSKISESLIKKSRFSGKNRLNRVRLTCLESTSVAEKSVLMVSAAFNCGVIL